MALIVGAACAAAQLGRAETPPAADAGAAERLAAAAPDRLADLQAATAAAAREAIAELAATGDWTASEIERLVSRLTLDPARFAADGRFRSRVVPTLAAALPADAPTALRDALLLRFSGLLDLHDLAAIEAGWGVAARGVDERLAGVGDGAAAPGVPVVVDWPDVRLGDPEAPIGLSVYSLASRFFAPAEALTFLEAVRRWAPERAIVVLADYRQSRDLAARAGALGIHVGQTWSRAYSPWPRDPMSFLVQPDGARVAVLRPNRQAGRELDSAMALELIQDLPDELDRRFGPLTWTVAPIPFHNGNLLPAGDEIWLSIHSLEPRILELLRIERVPVDSFARPDGVVRYLATARLAAQEIARLFGRTVRFVHPLPDDLLERSAGDGAPEASAAAEAAMRRLGGGAGFDLDSLVTLLPQPEGGPAALVGDLEGGARLLVASSDAELQRMRTAYGLAPAPAELRAEVERWHRGFRGRGLGSFLDLIADHLAASGFSVHRLPLLLVPTALLDRPQGELDPDFIVGWNNVVLERVGDARRAEGFAAGLDGGDATARALFARLGYRLELLPALIESVVRNGGYRCASNHLRE